MKSQYLSPPNFLNALICLLPLSFILGNSLINIEIVLISLIGILFYKNQLFDFKKDNVLILIIIFFVTLIFSTLLEIYKNPETFELKKAILFLRYLIFVIVLRCIVLKEHLNFKMFLLSCLLFATFLSIDIIFQYSFGFNILGWEAAELRRSSFFGSEFVAGGYIQRFSVLGIFVIPFFLKKNYHKIIVAFLALIICFLGIFLSGNRMPTIMFLFFIILLSLVFSLKKIKYTLQLVLALLVIIGTFSFSVGNIKSMQMNYLRFLGGMPEPAKIISELRRDYPELKRYKGSKKKFHETDAWNNKSNYEIYHYRTGYTQLYITSLDIISDNPMIGRGIKSFRNSCWEIVYLPNRVCENHPHNFYLEILNDTGFVGLVIIMLALLLLLIKIFKKYGNRFDFFYYPFLFSLVIEFFPLRSSGSFFSTSNAAFIFLLIGILIGMKELKNKN
tara:strand:- start:5801 stop:7138 length:1338 start_codon:yes stop_codon:yes gene_type:complete